MQNNVRKWFNKEHEGKIAHLEIKPKKKKKSLARLILLVSI